MSSDTSDFRISPRNWKIRTVGTIKEGEKAVHKDDMTAAQISRKQPLGYQ